MKHARGDTPWDVEANADFDGIDAEIARPRLPFNSPTVGATTTCDLATARVFVFTVSQATTLSLTNVPSASFACRIRLLITNGSAFVLTFPASVTWLSGVVPVFKAAGVDEVELLTKDAGITWYAALRADRRVQFGSATSLVVPIGIPVGSTDTSTTTSGAGSPVNLKSYIVPAAALGANNQGIRIRGWGTTANNANAKTVRIKIAAAVLITVTTQVSIVDHWWIDAMIFRTSATAANVIVMSQTKGTGAKNTEFTNVGGVSDWTTTGNTIQFDCTQTAAADVIQNGVMPEWLGF